MFWQKILKNQTLAALTAASAIAPMEQSCNWEERAFDVMEQFNVFPPPPGPPMGMASPRVSPPQQSPQGKTVRMLTQSLLPLA